MRFELVFPVVAIGSIFAIALVLWILGEVTFGWEAYLIGAALALTLLYFFLPTGGGIGGRSGTDVAGWSSSDGGGGGNRGE